MKLLLSLLLLGTAGWYGLTPKAGPDTTPAPDVVPAATATECPPTGCTATVEPGPDGTCVITCRDESGEVVCQERVDCDRPGDCDRPCAQKSGCPIRCER